MNHKVFILGVIFLVACNPRMFTSKIKVFPNFWLRGKSKAHLPNFGEVQNSVTFFFSPEENNSAGDRGKSIYKKKNLLSINGLIILKLKITNLQTKILDGWNL